MKRKMQLCAFLTVFALLMLHSKDTTAQLKAAFSASLLEGCAPLVVKFTDNSTGGAVYWRWDLGNGNVSYLQNPSAAYFNAGQYTVKLVVRNAANQYDSLIKTAYINVQPKPVVDFSASATTGCFPLRAQFSDLSTPAGSIAKWEWDFSDGAIDSVRNPVHEYTDAGNYSVTLRVTTDKGCVTTLTKTDYIQLVNGVKANFNFTAPNSCSPPATVNFTNSSTGTGALTYLWDFGDGGTSTSVNPSHVYSTPGTFSVMLTVTNNLGCVDTMRVANAISIGNVQADFTVPAAVCQGENFTIANTSNPAPGSALWNFGDGTTSTVLSPVKKYNTAGNYTITLISSFGACKDTVTKTIQVRAGPTAAFTAANTKSCKAPLAVTFTNASTGATGYQWLFGDAGTSTDQNPVYTYNQEGDFDVTLIVTDSIGCTDTLTKPDLVTIKPATIEISNLPLSGCLPVTFAPKYTVTSVDPITTFLWNFGDGSTSTAANPSHVYNTEGTYQISLTYTTAGGCTGTITSSSTVNVGTKPKANFAATPRSACAFSPIQFTDQSTGGVDNWLWDFGDGNTSTEANPAHVYQDTGYFDITLTVWNSGCADSISFNNYIQILPPVAKFWTSPNCANSFTVNFSDQSLGATSWLWNFGDGNTSTLQNPSHTYSAEGDYTVTLTVRNSTCEHTTTQQVLVVKTVADFIANDTVICRNSGVTFQTQGVNPVSIASYQWNFGDGSTAEGSDTITHVYTKSGRFTVRLTLTDVNGCTSVKERTQYIQVNGPAANFTVAAGGSCSNTPVLFTNTSASDGINPITQFTWNYGDGQTETLTAPPFQHTYQSAGVYTVSLTVVDSVGCVDSIVKTEAVIISKPVVDFSSTDTMFCPGKAVRFTNLSQANLPATYTWSFGDGQTSSVEAPDHVYTTTGNFTVRLVIRDVYGCTDSITKTQFIKIDKPVAAFLLNDSIATCPPLIANFTNQSSYYSSFEWSFGDGGKSSLPDPDHFYNLAGTFIAKLVVASPGGCRDSATKRIVISGPEGSFTYDKVAACAPGTIQFTATTRNSISTTWDFGDGTILTSNNASIPHVYSSVGEYLPKIIIEDRTGCKVPIAAADTIRISGADANFTMNNSLLCDSGVVNFRDSSSSNDPITGYLWNFGDGNTSTAKDPDHFYSSAGDFTIRLIVTTAIGCKDTIERVAPVKIVQSPQITIGGDTASCVSDSILVFGNLLRGDSLPVTWQWDFGNGSTSTLQNPVAVFYNNDGSYNVTAIVVDAAGCRDTARKNILIGALPTISAGASDTICRGNTYTLNATGADKYAWSPAALLSCTDCASPVVRPDTTTSFYLSAETNLGCKGQDTVVIAVKQPITMSVSAGDTLCLGRSLTMTATGAELYTWTPSTGLNNAVGATVIATPTQTTTYQVVGTDSRNCFSDTGIVIVPVYPYPTVNAGQDQSMPIGGSVKIDAQISTDVQSILWLPSAGLSCNNCVSPTATPKATTTYKIEVANEAGCVASDEVIVSVVCRESSVFIPNTFSPNGDGRNETFYPQGKDVYRVKSMKIFNRWGELIYEKNNFNANSPGDGWDGKYKGQLVSSDVYVYLAEVLCENNQVMLFKGNVALVR